MLNYGKTVEFNIHFLIYICHFYFKFIINNIIKQVRDLKPVFHNMLAHLPIDSLKTRA
jgi:hypothetical protein